MTPTARSLAWLREQGWTAEKVEQRLPIPGRFVTKDMGGFADGVAWAQGKGILAWQATSATNVAARLNKIAGNEKALAWLLAGGRLEVHGWGLRGKRGERKTWQVRSVVLVEQQGAIVEAALTPEAVRA